MPLLHQTEFWIIHDLPLYGLLVMQRTAQPCRTRPEIVSSFQTIVEISEAYRAQRYLGLADLRPAPMRNDPEFEDVSRPYRASFTNNFSRLTFLVRSLLGKQQIKRYNHEQQRIKDTACHQSEEEALRYLGAPPSIDALVRRVLGT